jgi:hypothetical protein
MNFHFYVRVVLADDSQIFFAAKLKTYKYILQPHNINI